MGNPRYYTVFLDKCQDLSLIYAGDGGPHMIKVLCERLGIGASPAARMLYSGIPPKYYEILHTPKDKDCLVIIRDKHLQKGAA